MSMKKKRMSEYQRLMGLSPAQRDAEVAEFDREFVAEEFSAPPPEAKKVHDKVKRGRPRIGGGAKRVLVTVERSLLKRADAEAKRRHMSRAEFVATGLMLALAK
jgi:hypothetical protein